MKRKALLVVAALIGGPAFLYFILSSWLDIFEAVWRLFES